MRNGTQPKTPLLQRMSSGILQGLLQTSEQQQESDAEENRPRTGNNTGVIELLGKIKSIKEVYGVRIAAYGECEGYEVETEENTFQVLIGSGQQCCEEYGYFESEDDLTYFVGTNLLEVNLTDIELNKKILEMANELSPFAGIQFVDFVTDKGTFQLAVYNSHNGYYGHSIYVTKNKEIILDSCL